VGVEASASPADGAGHEPVRVCLVGAGRLASALALRISVDTDVIVVSRHSGRLARPDGRPDIIVSDDPATAATAELVLLAVPADEIAAAARWLAPHLPAGVVIANMATELATAPLASLLPGCRVVACKVVGQAAEIAQGSPTALVVSGATPEETSLVAAALADVGTVVVAAEEVAAQVNELAARRIVAAHQALSDELDKLAVPDSIREPALANLAVGVLRALSTGTAGPYLCRIIEENAASAAAT
jgi:pyrroline-5-carboxylate reductase